jgi:DNA-directed RNA polymerase specialized sigma24 family protein
MNIDFQTETTDIEIVEKIKKGSTKDVQLAQSQFYKRYAGYIYKIALQGCSNFSDPEFFAKEVLQKTFIKAFEYIRNFNLKEGLDDNQTNKIIKA